MGGEPGSGENSKNPLGPGERDGNQKDPGKDSNSKDQVVAHVVLENDATDKADRSSTPHI